MATDLLQMSKGKRKKTQKEDRIFSNRALPLLDSNL
jgi:hypothetical protein